MTDKTLFDPLSPAFDPQGGKQDAQAGQQQAEDAASAALKAALSIAIEETAELYGRFTSDHVWHAFRLSHPDLPVPEPRVLGPMLLKAFKAGLIRRTQETAPSQRKDRQSGTVAIYESLRAYTIALAPGTPPAPAPAPPVLGGVLGEIMAERARQDAKWGGPSHDDEHPLGDWMDFIQIQVSNIFGGVGSKRVRLIRIAALALAAVESLDRQSQKKATAAE